MKVGIIGTGKLGGPVSEVFAESGHEVFAYDIAGGKNIKVTEEGGSRKYYKTCLLYTSPSPRDKRQSRMPSSA